MGNISLTKTVSAFTYFALIIFVFRFVHAGFLLMLIALIGILVLHRYSREVYVGVASIILFYLIYTYFGWSNYELGSKKLVSHVLLFAVPSIFLFLFAYERQRRGVFKYAVISLIYAYLVVLLSYLGGYSGYGSLYDIAAASTVNSPPYAILIAISTIVICEYFKIEAVERSIFLRIAMLLVALYVCAAYLQSRAAVLMLSVFFLWHFHVKQQVFVLIGGSLAVLLWPDVFNLALRRLSLFGLESVRWDLWSYGVVEMFQKPFGGMKVVDANTRYKGIWFHNLYLDLARVAGVFAVIYWVALQITFTIKAFINLSGIDFKFYATVLVFLFLAYFQDVAFEGHYNGMMFFFLLFGMALSSRDETSTMVIADRGRIRA